MICTGTLRPVGHPVLAVVGYMRYFILVAGSTTPTLIVGRGAFMSKGWIEREARYDREREKKS